jgi:hypothetical protein
MANILSKLGAANRRDAASPAKRDGIDDFTFPLRGFPVTLLALARLICCTPQQPRKRWARQPSKKTE